MYCYCHIQFLHAFFGIAITSHKYEPRNFLLHLVFCFLCDALDFIVFVAAGIVFAEHDFYMRVSDSESGLVLCFFFSNGLSILILDSPHPFLCCGSHNLLAYRNLYCLVAVVQMKVYIRSMTDMKSV